ncbi:MAG: vitamin K epoxide reductase family protein [Candidatus Omnitrophota bacterium]
MSNKKIYSFVLFLTVAGFLISLYLSQHHYALSRGTALAFQLCRKGCDTVNTSSYSEIFGIPIASYGATMYFGLFILAVLGLLLEKTTLNTFLLSLIFLVSLPCLAASVALAAISIFILASFCSLCAYTYLINFLLVLVSGWRLKTLSGSLVKPAAGALGELLQKEKVDQEGFYRKLGMKLLFFFFLLSFASGLAVSYFHSQKYRLMGKEQLQMFLENFATQPRFTIKTQNAPAQGSQNPRLTLVVFTDFNCPHCRDAAIALRRLLPEYRNDLRIVFKHHPLDKTCNPYVGEVTTSCLFAKASICAQKQGKFWEYHDLLFASKKKINEKDLLSLASQAKINSEVFEECLNTQEVQKQLEDDVLEGKQLGVHSTPTLFLNGRMIRGLPPSYVLHTLIQREIRETSAPQ